MVEYYALLAAIAALLFARITFKRVTVYEYERGLKYGKGKFTDSLGAGRHWIYKPTTEIRRIDTRPRFISIPSQEVLSSDGVTLKVSIAAEFEIVDAGTAVNKVENYHDALYLTLQLALREIIGQAKIDDVLSQRDRFGERLSELCSAPIEVFGLRLLSVNLKDIMFPGELKKIFAQVVAAQKDGLASLERARGETAALRHLANAAQLVDGNPALMQLRLLQQLATSTGNTLVLGFPTGSTPLPMNGPDAGGRQPSQTPGAEEED